LLELTPVLLFVALFLRRPLRSLSRRLKRKRQESYEIRRDYDPIEPS
jgi:hypothetical protein